METNCGEVAPLPASRMPAVVFQIEIVSNPVIGP